MIRNVLLIIAAIAITGCGAVKGALRPWVCDCETDKEMVCADGSTALAASEQPFLEAKSNDPDEIDAVEEEEPKEDLNAPRNVVDPFEDSIVSPASPGWPQLVSSVGLPSELPASSVILRGEFDRRGSTEAVMLVPAQEIRIYGENRRQLKESIVEDFSNEGVAKIWSKPVTSAKLVDDNVSEILVVGLDTSGEIELVTLSVYKVFGDRIGRVFSTEIGRVGPDGISKTVEIEFVSGRRHVGIRRTPLDSSGAPDPGRSETFEWNKWEGMFRVPAPPPTAKAKPVS